MKSKRNYSGVIITIFSLILAFVFVIPLIWMVFVSLRHEGDVINNVLSWFKPPYSLMTYPKVLRTSGMTTWIFNSLFISVVSTIATVTVSSIASYALSKVIKGKYNKYIMLFILFGLMLPGRLQLYHFIRLSKILIYLTHMQA